MAKRFFWKVWLRLNFNFLTQKMDNDIVEVSTAGETLHNEDLARLIVKERSELNYETILSILNRRDDMVCDSLLRGSSVQDSIIKLAPQVSRRGDNPKDYKKTVVATLTAEMRKALDEVGIDVLGVKSNGGAIIGLVTDVLTGKTDGTVSMSGAIIITGKKIKIAPAGETGMGIFFVSDSGVEIPLDHPVIENNPKRIICRVPGQLTDGVYTLKIVTRYSNGSTLLNTPRTILYEFPLMVETSDTQS